MNNKRSLKIKMGYSIGLLMIVLFSSYNICKNEENKVCVREISLDSKDLYMPHVGDFMIYPEVVVPFDDPFRKALVVFDSLIQFITEHDIKIELVVHTDTRGSNSGNDTVTEKFAVFFKDYFIDNGLDDNNIISFGAGEQYPRLLHEDKEVVIKGQKFTFSKGTLLNDKYIKNLTNKNQIEAAHSLNRRIRVEIIDIY